MAVLILFSCLSLSSMTGLTSAAVTTSGIQSFYPSSLVKTDGTYWIWGSFRQSVPTQLQGLTEVESSFADNLIQKKDHTVWHWEKDYYSSDTQVNPVPVQQLYNLVAVYYDYKGSLALDADGKVYLIPKTDGKANLEQITPLLGIDNVKSISRTYEVVQQKGKSSWLFLKMDGSVWKAEDSLQSFEPVDSLDHVTDININMALKEDGTVWTWPSVFVGNVEQDVLVPGTKLEELTNIRTIKTMLYSYLAIDKESRLWFWGGTITGYSDMTMVNSHPNPILITSIKDVKDAFVVERSLIVLTGEGNVYETSIDREKMPSNPVFKLLATEISQIKADWRHIIMQKNNGTLWGWGVNKNGELGYGDYEFMHNTPVPLQQPISVYLNGEPVILTNGVVTRNGEAFIPIRSVFEKMGAVVSWDNKTKTVTIKQSGAGTTPITIQMNYITGVTDMNHEPVDLKNPPLSIAGSSYLPIRFVSEALGAKVEWFQKEQKIEITMH